MIDKFLLGLNTREEAPVKPCPTNDLQFSGQVECSGRPALRLSAPWACFTPALSSPSCELCCFRKKQRAGNHDGWGLARAHALCGLSPSAGPSPTVLPPRPPLPVQLKVPPAGRTSQLRSLSSGHRLFPLLGTARRSFPPSRPARLRVDLHHPGLSLGPESIRPK